MIKKSFIQSIADENAKVNTLCEYLGTLRTECMRTYQSAEAKGTHNFGKMHEIYTLISDLNKKLDGLVSSYILSNETTCNQNYESIRNLVLSVDNNGKHKGAFIAYFDRIEKDSLPFVYSVSECCGVVTKLYNSYLTSLDSVRNERGKREKLADRKARLLAELAALESEENKK